MAVEFEVSTFINAPVEAVYSAWLDSDEHSKMTGAEAKVSDEQGGSFTAWDGYIEGVNLELEPPRRILQSWRTSEFDPQDEDSRLEILFSSEGTGTALTIKHVNLPAHGMQYKQGWVDNYFEPMRQYFITA